MTRQTGWWTCYGDLHGLRAASKKLQGLNEKTERVRLDNVWLDK
jgi:hypothetical protein